MQREKKPADSEFSDSDRARLNELLEDEEFRRRLEERHKKRVEAVKAWATWLITVTAALSLIKDAAAAFIRHAADWFGVK